MSATSKTGFPARAREALADTQLRHNLGHATQTIRAKRNAVVAELPDWGERRAARGPRPTARRRHTGGHPPQPTRERRTAVGAELPDWEDLRPAGAQLLPVGQ